MDHLSLLPAELQWEIYRYCWRGCIRDVHRELLQKVELAHGDPHAGPLFDHGSGWRRGHHGAHRYDWGLWMDGAARLYLCADGSLFCGCHIYRYRNIFSHHEQYCHRFKGRYRAKPECRLVSPAS
jgi:hypothetical protein